MGCLWLGFPPSYHVWPWQFDRSPLKMTVEKMPKPSLFMD